MSKVKILIADGQSIARIGLRTMLHETNRFVVVGEADDPETFDQLIPKHDPDIVILDWCLPRLETKISPFLRDNTNSENGITRSPLPG